MEPTTAEPRVAPLTVAGLALLLIPLLTMWHEIGGHAAACVLVGGRVRAIGAFYVDCDAPGATAAVIVALAGVTVNAVLSVVAWQLWRRARADMARLTLWYVWVAEAFVAAGYFVFSGFSGFGDLGTSTGGALRHLPYPAALRIGEVVVGIASYFLLVRAAIATLRTMLGTGPRARPAFRTVAHLFYGCGGVTAVLVGALNPLGLVITIMSAAASSFGGLAGMISVGFAPGDRDAPRAFMVERRPMLLFAGIGAVIAFALILGPTVRF